MALYTRGGDKGKTSLIGGERRFKDDLRVEAYGNVDELGAVIGIAMAELTWKGSEDVYQVLEEIAQRLWDVGADIAATPDAEYVFRTPEDAALQLEPIIDSYESEVETITKFILRGGDRGAAMVHLACTVCRRTERSVVRLMQVEEVHQPALKYLNRLSDLLFVIGRTINGRRDIEETTYENSPEVFRQRGKKKL